jgi:alpha-glucosidase
MSRVEGQRPWWETAVFYEVYPRSFFDSNGDGVGDLPGITAKLDYFVELGVDALWLTPFFVSPQVDFGYDVADYEQIDPQFGTLADFDRLIAEAHRRNLKVVTDLVLNHTSDQHRFFQESRSSRTNPKRDWYIWRDPAPGGGPPNNWTSVFGPQAWTFDPATRQYYYHFFYPQQPDLNWRNPAVERAMFSSVLFWLDRGVDGFRLDAIDALFEDVRLTDNPELPTLRPGSGTEREQEQRYNRGLADTHLVLQRLRQLVDRSIGTPGRDGRAGGERVLIGEIFAPTMDQLMAYYGSGANELSLPFNFFFTEVKALDAGAFRREVERAERALNGRPTTYVLSSHDIPRAYDRYTAGLDPVSRDRVATLLATMILTLRGSPFLYYGEELGMVTTEPKTLDEVRDPVGRKYWPANKGRDGERTPMQWDAGPQAGFTTGTPWLPIPTSAVRRNVAVQRQQPDSIWRYYQLALRTRRGRDALRLGSYEALGDAPDLFLYRRRHGAETVLVALNFAGQARTALLPAAPAPRAPTLRVLYGNHRRTGAVVATAPAPQGHRRLALAPYEAVVLSVGAAPP